ncbi:MAG: tetratricopeptide repeat protein [Bryobacteraceae bacterium]|nr:tetratricopeptide repeat protein [Bryobacteraceae bacterium]
MYCSWLVVVFLAASAALAAADAAQEQMEKAVRAQKAGDLSAAAAAYRLALQSNPRLTLAHHLLGVCELQLGNLNKGMEHLEIVLRQDPANRQAAYTLVSTYIATGMLAEAGKVIDTALRADSSAAGHLMRGSLQMALGEYEVATHELEQARKLDGRLPGVVSQLGVAYCFANRLDDAIPVLEAALRENPEDANAAAFLGWLYKDRDRDKEAATLLESAVRARPSDKGAWFLLAQLAQNRGEPAHAAELLQKVVEMDPGFRPAHVLLARVYQQLRRPEDAARERAIVDRLNAEQQASQPAAPPSKH